MAIRIKRHWILVLSCLIISGCSEKTIIREVPASSEPEAGIADTVIPDSGSPLTPTVGGGSNMVTAGPDTDTVIDADSTVVTDADPGQLEDPQTPVESVENPAGAPQLQDPINETVDGAPGLSVDCESTLPCRWISDDSQFTITVTSADNIGSRDRLQLNYSLSAVHDTQVSVAGGGQALDDTGMQYQPGEQTLGTGASGNAQTMLAGKTLDGAVVFDQGAETSTLSKWSITILDGGVARLPSFSNIPIGTITTDYADCELVLPCVWLTPQGNVSITLTSAGGYTTNSRLSTTFTVQSSTTIDVALDAGAFAISSEGTQFNGRTHGLGASKGFAKITAEAYAGYGLTGVVDYYRNSAEPTALNELTLVLYQDSPIPRWNPKFINVPVQ